jgi:hypothetical protein
METLAAEFDRSHVMSSGVLIPSILPAARIRKISCVGVFNLSGWRGGIREAYYSLQFKCCSIRGSDFKMGVGGM